MCLLMKENRNHKIDDALTLDNEFVDVHCCELRLLRFEQHGGWR